MQGASPWDSGGCGGPRRPIVWGSAPGPRTWPGAAAPRQALRGSLGQHWGSMLPRAQRPGINVWRPLHQRWLGLHIIVTMLIRRMYDARNACFFPTPGRQAGNHPSYILLGFGASPQIPKIP